MGKWEEDMKPYWDIRQGDVLDRLRDMPDESVHCCITSPPYWGLRDYGLPASVWDGTPTCEHEWGEGIKGRTQSGSLEGSTLEGTSAGSERTPSWESSFCANCNAWIGALGLEPDIDLYVAHIVKVFREVRRALRKDGSLWLNLGDGYAGSPKGNLNGQDKSGLTSTKTQEYSPIGAHKRGNGLKPKDLVGLPWRVAFALQADGWWLRSPVIWHKLNPMPESATDRPTLAHEYLFLLTKSGTSQYWTHRDQSGTRVRPLADYRWLDQSNDLEYDAEPLDWSDEVMACPGCQGAGWHEVRQGQISMFDGIPAMRFPCSRCNPGGEEDSDGTVDRWKRVNLWTAHDYFYDPDAVRQPAASGPSDLRKMAEAKDRIGGKHKHLDDLLSKASSTTNIGRKRAVGDPSGRNIQTVWSIATQPYKGRHFATFPEKLVEPCILAGTGGQGVCGECGAPWEREVSGTAATMNIRVRDASKGVLEHKSGFGGRASATAAEIGGYGEERLGDRVTIGWQPTCDHDTNPMPATVMDPFCGSGTTGVVALRHGRSFVGIELNSEYVELARERIIADAPLLTGGTSR